MSLAAIPSIVTHAFAAVGLAACALGAALAWPLEAPPPLQSVAEGAKAVGKEGRPELTRFQARDGTWLAYRCYPATNGATDRLAFVAHGSSASSDAMNEVSRALAANGFMALAIDARGHGASGTRGDIGYIGQLDDDLADLIAHIRKTYPTARLTFVGHSSGGGFVARIAGGPLGGEFERFVLLSPFLGAQAPTTRGVGGWVKADIPRILALELLRRIGVDWAQSLPVLAFANPPEAAPFVTLRYSYRLMTDYAAAWDWRAAFLAARGKFALVAGADDELMDPAAYRDVLEPLGVKVEIVPGVDHMGMVHQPAALAAMVAAAK